MFWAEIWKISEFLSENFHFWMVKFSVYLNRLIFVRRSTDPEAITEGEIRNNSWQTYTIWNHRRTKTNCNRGISFDRSVEKYEGGGINQFYSCHTSLTLNSWEAPNVKYVVGPQKGSSTRSVKYPSETHIIKNNVIKQSKGLNGDRSQKTRKPQNRTATGLRTAIDRQASTIWIPKYWDR